MIGYYVHHHGAGHLARALAIVGPAVDRFTLLGTGLEGRTGQVAAVDLADDRPIGSTLFDGRDGVPDRPEALHYAPLHHPGVRSRTAAIVNWIENAAPSLMVVDVSVETAMLARLTGTPTICVRLAGDRTDPAHLDAFRGATAILAPFHKDLEDAATPDWVRRKTRYAPGMGTVPPVAAVDERRVVVVFGAGGGEADGEALADAARRMPDLEWRVLGPMSVATDAPDNLVSLGWVDNAAEEIAGAGVVVGSAGNGVVGAVLAADRPFICLPQARPFDEQLSTARALERVGAAVVLEAWPEVEVWPDLLDRARAPVGDARRRLVGTDEAADVRQWIFNVADTREHRPGATS